jgi:hypothetical protein
MENALRSLLLRNSNFLALMIFLLQDFSNVLQVAIMLVQLVQQLNPPEL